MSERQPQQTIEFAYDHQRDQLMRASDLLEMSEEEFSQLRRTTLSRKRESPILTCGACGTAVYLSRKHLGFSDKNRYFAHKQHAVCGWYSGHRLTQAQLRALQFNGQKEGALHRTLKHFIAQQLGADTACSEVVEDQYLKGDVLIQERRRPDVRCDWRGKRLVFELQVSYTFLTEVLARDTFYQAEGCQVIWVFAEAQMDRSVVLDEMYFNQRNLFVLDDDAKRASLAAGKLMLTCVHEVPSLNDIAQTIEDQTKSQLVSLEDLTYADGGFRPYFFNYLAARAALQSQLSRMLSAQRLALAQRENERARQEQAECDKARREATERYRTQSADQIDTSFVSNHPACRVMNVMEKLSGPEDSISVRDNAFLQHAGEIVHPIMREALRKAAAYPFIDILLRLHSIAIGRPITTRYPTVYQLVDASLQDSATTKRPFSALLVAACAAYKPHMSPQQEKSIRDKQARIITQLQQGDSELLPPTFFTELVCWMYPDMAEQVSAILGHFHKEDHSPSADAQDDALVSGWPRPPPLVWAPRETLRRDKVSEAGSLYKRMIKETDWHEVYRSAIAARNEGQDVRAFMNSIAVAVNERVGNILNFLTRCGVIRVRQ